MGVLERYQAEVVAALGAVVPPHGILRPLVGYPLGAVGADGGPGPGIGGKLIRPALVLFACEALGGRPERALPLAAAVELVHTFSLVHDDIVDGDRLRRGRPAAWVAFGQDQAIHAGDGLLALAFQTAARAALPGEGTARAVDALASATLAMVEGQARDLDLEGRPAGTDAYLEMTRGKTGALLGCALELGALAAERGDLAPAHRTVGELLGVAFQIRDDWLGVWGEADAVGKAVGGDIARGKRSYPIAWALERDPTLRDSLRNAPLDEAQARLVALGAREATERQADELLVRARAQARTLPWPAWAHDGFAELCAELAARVR
ncbi:MAG: hypothetical protein BIP78_1406 [Candidatus Bipolaricaulis sibiricus]|uniref:Polyprenyl synthetase family protein n=1 Tax=Bipolaricaulis sibiricus TaxID=2501609 RepID=A0A410FW21_BIPS1|nr:MAG: hypothetical protein BIP78_1406 [Candidatus Bipolaricaulis sibiricus]